MDGEVLDRRPDGAVLVRTRVGDILGRWADDKHPVCSGRAYSFEFDFNLVLTGAHRVDLGSEGVRPSASSATAPGSVAASNRWMMMASGI